ncbi:MAG: hypothetical protein RXR36_04870 [Nitrososphaeria archaeon]|jgi:hypothetical protein
MKVFKLETFYELTTIIQVRDAHIYFSASKRMGVMENDGLLMKKH